MFYVKHERCFTPQGEKLQPVYTSTIDPITGDLEIVVDKFVDAYAEIQSYKESCDLKEILKRYLAGDETALNRRQMFYTDVTELPKTLGEVYKFVIDGNNAFYDLPVEVREQYDHNPAKFFAAFDTFDDMLVKIAENKKTDNKPTMGIVKNQTENTANYTVYPEDLKNNEKEVKIDGNESE